MIVAFPGHTHFSYNMLYDVFLKIVLILVNSADPDKMPSSLFAKVPAYC